MQMQSEHNVWNFWISLRWGHQFSMRGGVPTYDFAKFSQKLHETERIWTRGGEETCRVTHISLRSATAVCYSHVTIGTMLNLSGGKNGHWLKNLMCKQTFTLGLIPTSAQTYHQKYRLKEMLNLRKHQLLLRLCTTFIPIYMLVKLITSK